MNRARAALLLAIVFAFIPATASAGQGRGPVASIRDRQVVVLVEDRVSFEEVLAVPLFRRLAAAGGAALMTTKTTTGDRTASSYLTIENGALTEPGSAGRALTRALAAARLSVCIAHPGPLPVLPNDPSRTLGPDCAQRREPGIAPLGFTPNVLFVDAGDTLRVDQALRLGRPGDERAEDSAILRQDARDLVPRLGDEPTLVMVVAPSTSLAMDRVGDEVTPLVMAEGVGDRLLPPSGPPHALTSVTTRADGVVANVDVAPTILRWLGVPIPSSMDGQPIAFTDAPAPFALHRLHLEQRRTRLPIDLAVVSFIAASGVFGIGVLVMMGLRGDVSARVRRAMRFVLLAASALYLVILGGGLLPHMTYAWVVPYLVMVTAALAWLAGRAKDGPSAPFGFLGITALLFVLIDALFRGNAFRIPLYGNTMFDGARFYGISNSFITLLVASAVWIAATSEREAGTALIFGVGLLMGFPRLGINVGGSIALFAAAGIWWAITAGRPRTWASVVWGVVVTAVATAAGLAVVLLANRYLPGAPTHAARFVERASGDTAFGVHTVLRRVTVGFSQFGHVPAAWIPILGLPIVLAFVLWGPGPIGRGYRPVARWRDATVTLILAAVVAYFANDTGVAAAAPAFLYAMAMMVFAAITWGRRGDQEQRRALRTREAIRT